MPTYTPSIPDALSSSSTGGVSYERGASARLPCPGTHIGARPSQGKAIQLNEG